MVTFAKKFSSDMFFQPRLNDDTPCWHCHFFEGFDGPAALCNKANYSHVRATPEWGCAGFEREPGSDDEPLASMPEFSL